MITHLNILTARSHAEDYLDTCLAERHLAGNIREASPQALTILVEMLIRTGSRRQRCFDELMASIRDLGRSGHVEEVQSILLGLRDGMAAGRMGEAREIVE